MEMRIAASYYPHHFVAAILPTAPISLRFFSSSISDPLIENKKINLERSFPGLKYTKVLSKRSKHGIVVASTNHVAAPSDSWKPGKTASTPSFSDVFWPSAGAFAAMAAFGNMDQILAPKGISMTIAPFGAVCALLFATPSSPAARKYNVFMAQIGCAAIGVLAFSLLGPSWLVTALAAFTAFTIYTRSAHPPAASLPLLFIDGVKFHHLNFWYALFPGAAGCVLLCLMQEMVFYLKENFKF